MRFLLATTLPLFLLASIRAEEPPAESKPVAVLAGIQASPAVFDDSTRQKPLVFKSAEQAGKYFEKEELEKLIKQVEFKDQIVLVFAWKGSGQDKFTYEVGESHPEHIFFKYQAGRTRDLRPHVKIFVLRNNVKWTAK
jgi:hypothetical protein